MGGKYIYVNYDKRNGLSLEMNESGKVSAGG